MVSLCTRYELLQLLCSALLQGATFVQEINAIQWKSLCWAGNPLANVLVMGTFKIAPQRSSWILSEARGKSICWDSHKSWLLPCCKETAGCRWKCSRKNLSRKNTHTLTREMGSKTTYFVHLVLKNKFVKLLNPVYHWKQQDDARLENTWQQTEMPMKLMRRWYLLRFCVQRTSWWNQHPFH